MTYNKVDLGAIKNETVEKCGLTEFCFEDVIREDGYNAPYRRFYAVKRFGTRSYYMRGAWALSDLACILPELIAQLKKAFDEAEKQVTHDVQ